MRFPIVLTVLFGAPSLLTAQNIQGTWQPVEVLVKGGPEAGRHIIDVQPGLLILTERHYAYVHVQGFVPRAALGNSPPRDELCQAWEPFVANAGTYTVTDSTLSVDAIVGKNPGALRRTTRVRFVADSLWFLFREPRDGSEREGKWVRIERPEAK